MQVIARYTKESHISMISAQISTLEQHKQTSVDVEKKSLDQADVVFGYMPYHRLTHPALGASILKTCLEEQGIKTKIRYLGLQFAEKLGINLYNSILNSRSPWLQAEWTFAEAAFKEGFIDQRTEEIGRAYPWATKGTKIATNRASRWIDEAVENVIQFNPKIVVCSSMFQQNVASLALLRGIKERRPNIYTIMGGPNTEGILGIALLRRAPWLDYVCSGEGEEVLPELCSMLLTKQLKEKLPLGVTNQQGISQYEGIYNTEIARPSLSNMNTSPVPNFEDFFEAIETSSIKINPGLLLESSRGCWWGQRNHCTFCGLNGDGMAYRARDPENMLGIVKTTTNKHSVKKIEFVDNIIAKSYFSEFLPLLEEEELTIFYETKASIIENDILAFRKSGVRFIQPGIESLSDPVLKLMRKGTTGCVNIECLRLCREYGINPAWSILSGFPGEQIEWYAETLMLLPKLFHLRPPNGFIPIRYDRFSPYYDQAHQWQLELEPFEAYQHVYPPYQNQHDDIAYFFKQKGRDEVKDDGLGVWSKTHWKCKEIVDQWKKYWITRQENGQQQPRLLMIQGETTSIIDERDINGTTKTDDISEEMKQLLFFCKTKRTQQKIMSYTQSRKGEATGSAIESILLEALEKGWLVEINGQYISVVQLLNEEHLPLSEWPGGRILTN